jgi:hypothetical protein
MIRSLFLGLIVAALLATALGCSTGPAVATVNGTVTLDGKPLKEGTVNFIPLSENVPVAGEPIKDGKFTATVPVAKMRVEIHANKVIGQRKAYDTPDSPVVPIVEEAIPKRYNAESTLTIDVQRGSQDVPYDLTSKP